MANRCLAQLGAALARGAEANDDFVAAFLEAQDASELQVGRSPPPLIARDAGRQGRAGGPPARAAAGAGGGRGGGAAAGPDHRLPAPSPASRHPASPPPLQNPAPPSPQQPPSRGSDGGTKGARPTSGAAEGAGDGAAAAVRRQPAGVMRFLPRREQRVAVSEQRCTPSEFVLTPGGSVTLAVEGGPAQRFVIGLDGDGGKGFSTPAIPAGETYHWCARALRCSSGRRSRARAASCRVLHSATVGSTRPLPPPLRVAGHLPSLAATPFAARSSPASRPR